MNEKGEIIQYTNEQLAQLARKHRDALIPLSEEQAAILRNLKQSERAALYPLMTRRERRAKERAERKGK